MWYTNSQDRISSDNNVIKRTSNLIDHRKIKESLVMYRAAWIDTLSEIISIGLHGWQGRQHYLCSITGRLEAIVCRLRNSMRNLEMLRYLYCCFHLPTQRIIPCTQRSCRFLTSRCCRANAATSWFWVERLSWRSWSTLWASATALTRSCTTQTINHKYD